jgi:hypothetical protein
MSLDTLSGRFRHFHNLVYSALLKWPPPALMKLLSVFVFPAFSPAYIAYGPSQPEKIILYDLSRLAHF